MTTHELKPCPFCNERLNFIEPTGGEPVAQHPHSDECVLSQFFLWGDEPIASWNRRILSAITTEPAAPEPLRIAEERLSSILARIHRDGGHYEAEHGTEKAWTDADSIVAILYADTTHPAHSPAALDPAAPESQEVDPHYGDPITLAGMRAAAPEGQQAAGAVLASAHKLAREYRPSMDKDVLHSWASDAVKVIRVLSTRPAEQAVTDGPLAGMAKHLNWELDWGSLDPSDETSECAWRVHARSGGRNDREWTLLGTGETPVAALTAALAQKEVKP